jgi:hypothetical protein
MKDLHLNKKHHTIETATYKITPQAWTSVKVQAWNAKNLVNILSQVEKSK